MYLAKTKTPRKTNRTRTNRLKAKHRAKNKRRRTQHIAA
jgi:hypothetical protein